MTGSGSALLCQTFGVENAQRAYIDEGFVVLVHVPVGSGLPYQDTYLVGCSTHEEAEAKIKELYPSEPNVRLYVSRLRAGDRKDLKLARNEVREWQ
jgi:hypothetical protein